jgi:hypothetical protein
MAGRIRPRPPVLVGGALLLLVGMIVAVVVGLKSKVPPVANPAVPLRNAAQALWDGWAQRLKAGEMLTPQTLEMVCAASERLMEAERKVAGGASEKAKAMQGHQSRLGKVYSDMMARGNADVNRVGMATVQYHLERAKLREIEGE